MLKLDAWPFKRLQGLCPKCKKKRSLNGIKQKQESHWRAPNLNGIPVYICYRPHRILCPEHGAINEYIPWADGTSRFTPESDVKSPPSKFNFTELLNLNEKSFIILIMRASPLFYCLFVISIITNLKLFFYTLASLFRWNRKNFLKYIIMWSRSFFSGHDE